MAPLFPSERRYGDGSSRAVTDDALRSGLAEAVARHLPHQIGQLTPHVLRHFAASDLYRNGMDVVAIQEILGHEWLNTTMIYVHVEQSHVEDAGIRAGQRAAAGAGRSAGREHAPTKPLHGGPQGRRGGTSRTSHRAAGGSPDAASPVPPSRWRSADRRAHHGRPRPGGSSCTEPRSAPPGPEPAIGLPASGRRLGTRQRLAAQLEWIFHRCNHGRKPPITTYQGVSVTFRTSGEPQPNRGPARPKGGKTRR